MKEIIFFGLIGMSLVGSLVVGRKHLKTQRKPGKAMITAILINVIVLGLSCVWWFLTETDGFSQGIGVMVNLAAMAAISVLDVVFIYISYKLNKKVN